MYSSSKLIKEKQIWEENKNHNHVCAAHPTWITTHRLSHVQTVYHAATVHPSYRFSQQKRQKRQRCCCCWAKKWTWRRKSELSRPSLQCHTCYSGLTAAFLTALSNWAKCFHGWQWEGALVCVLESVSQRWRCRAEEREMPLAALFRPKQMDGNGDGRSLLPVYGRLKPKISEQLQAVIFTFWKSPNGTSILISQ